MGRLIRTLGLAMAVAFLATACADFEIEELEYTAPNDLLPGPGMFSGEKGEWVIYSR